MAIPTLMTERLTLRPFRTEDVDPLLAILSVGGVLRYFPNPQPPDRQRVERLVAHQLRHWDERGYGWWAVEPWGRRELIGWNGLQHLPETDEVEIGFLLARPYWGMGLAAEGARAGLRFGFRDLGLQEIIALAHPENARSRRVIEKLGMTLTGRARYFGMEVCRHALSAAAGQPSPARPESTYWVEPGRLLAGEYPGGGEDPQQALRELLDAGVTAFVDLTERGEHGTRPYDRVLGEEASARGIDVCYRRFSIRDFSVPSTRRMRAILKAIEELLAEGRIVYLHCFAGIGRTATVAGCRLVDRGHAAGEALAGLERQRYGVPYGGDPLPAAEAQREMVRAWEKARRA
ncbi:MAG: GNAT family N-acetyltransferase, partial [Candidatus Eisenbacteria bacterium]|nr:GNAT family N-acetyltransferase [Candidatus Eisenbacteria bacterium]